MAAINDYGDYLTPEQQNAFEDAQMQQRINSLRAAANVQPPPAAGPTPESNQYVMDAAELFRQANPNMPMGGSADYAAATRGQSGLDTRQQVVDARPAADTGVDPWAAVMKNDLVGYKAQTVDANGNKSFTSYGPAKTKEQKYNDEMQSLLNAARMNAGTPGGAVYLRAIDEFTKANPANVTLKEGDMYRGLNGEVMKNPKTFQPQKDLNYDQTMAGIAQAIASGEKVSPEATKMLQEYVDSKKKGIKDQSIAERKQMYDARMAEIKASGRQDLANEEIIAANAVSKDQAEKIDKERPGFLARWTKLTTATAQDIKDNPGQFLQPGQWENRLAAIDRKLRAEHGLLGGSATEPSLEDLKAEAAKRKKAPAGVVGTWDNTTPNSVPLDPRFITGVRRGIGSAFRTASPVIPGMFTHGQLPEGVDPNSVTGFWGDLKADVVDKINRLYR